MLKFACLCKRYFLINETNKLAMGLNSKRSAVHFFLALFALLLSVAATAQQRKVSGRVLGADGKPVAGASVTVNGTTTGTQTDASGNFTINVAGGKNALTISSVGFETRNVTLSGGNNISATLQPTTSNLNEIVLTGYTSQKKKD